VSARFDEYVRRWVAAGGQVSAVEDPEQPGGDRVTLLRLTAPAGTVVFASPADFEHLAEELLPLWERLQ
jgi:hypothetical protein